MILFIFEGKKTEPKIYQTIKELYFRDVEDSICIFGSNIYGLYDYLKKYYSDFKKIDYEANIIDVLKDIDKKYADSLENIERSSDIDQVFLFFDYDFQHAFHVIEQHPELSLSDALKNDNDKLLEMLDFFCEETEMGKLYINYPMVESLKYTKEVPDENYFSYKTTLDECHGKFKKKSEDFSAYKGYRNILLNSKDDIDNVKAIWALLISQNLMKANYICNNSYRKPIKKEDIAQNNIFNHQLDRYNNQHKIAILNAFPLFLYDYFNNTSLKSFLDSSNIQEEILI